MGGLARICKMYGSIEVSSDGKTIRWVWDYVNDKPRLESEMTKEEMMESEKAKWSFLKLNNESKSEKKKTTAESTDNLNQTEILF